MIDHATTERRATPAYGSAAYSSAAEPGGDALYNPWVATLAHELRSPLGAVLMALDELQRVCAAEPAARAAREVAERGSRQMSRVIDDVLDLSRGTRGKLSVLREPVDVPAVVAGAVAAARPTIAARRHRLTVSVPPGMVPLEAHGSRLEQVLTNLLTNAAKFTEPGGRIALAVEPAADVVAIRVRDDGIGIPPDLLPHVFEAYVQGPAARGRPHAAGLGIGLTLVRSLVRLMGGSVSAHSDGPGTGAEFIVRLPARASRPDGCPVVGVSVSAPHA